MAGAQEPLDLSVVGDAPQRAGTASGTSLEFGKEAGLARAQRAERLLARGRDAPRALERRSGRELPQAPQFRHRSRVVVDAQVDTRGFERTVDTSKAADWRPRRSPPAASAA